jgi:hypothetical protein
MVTTGCVGALDTDESDLATEPASVNETGLPADPPATGDRGLDEPPTLRVGEWWNVHLRSDVFGVDTEAKIVVAGVDGDRYMLGMPADDFEHQAMILHLPALGPVHRSSLGYESHDRLYEQLQFPLEESKTWSTEWYTGEVDAEVAETSEGAARVQLTGSSAINVTYDAKLGLPAKTEIADYGSYEVTDHGYGYEGTVRVPWNHDVLFLNGRLAGAMDTTLTPAPPVETLEVDEKYEGASVALLLGNLLVDGPPGAYRVSADVPNGETLEESFVPTPTGQQLRAVPHGVEDPSGTWNVEYEAGGPGIAAIEGLGYEIVEVSLPSGAIVAGGDTLDGS